MKVGIRYEWTDEDRTARHAIRDLVKEFKPLASDIELMSAATILKSNFDDQALSKFVDALLCWGNRLDAQRAEMLAEVYDERGFLLTTVGEVVVKIIGARRKTLNGRQL